MVSRHGSLPKRFRAMPPSRSCPTRCATRGSGAGTVARCVRRRPHPRKRRRRGLAPGDRRLRLRTASLWRKLNWEDQRRFLARTYGSGTSFATGCRPPSPTLSKPRSTAANWSSRPERSPRLAARERRGTVVTASDRTLRRFGDVVAGRHRDGVGSSVSAKLAVLGRLCWRRESKPCIHPGLGAG